jgi:hypothetical protein
MGLPAEVARYAYAWALANVEYIVETQGMTDMEKILDRVEAGSSSENAVHEVLRDSYADLMQGTAEYLKKRYGR